MFKRMKVSLTQPPLAIFFMKDKWTRVILYVFFVPLFLLIPFVLTSLISTDMSVNEVDALSRQINTNFRADGVSIVDGVLTGESDVTMTYAYFTLHIGPTNQSLIPMGLLFDTTELVLYTQNYELQRVSYESLGLSNYDFGDLSIQSSRVLARAFKQVVDQEPIILFVDFFYIYFDSLFNYISMILLISLMTMLFMVNVPIPYRFRFKISVYLTTIWVFSELMLILIDLRSFSFISTVIVYIYHIWAYRSVKVLPKE